MLQLAMQLRPRFALILPEAEPGDPLANFNAINTCK